MACTQPRRHNSGLAHPSVAVRTTLRASTVVRAEALGTPQRRVVVTGMGVVSSLGHDPDTMYSALLAGTSGVSLIDSFDTSDCSTKIAGQIRGLEPGDLLNKKQARRMDAVLQYALMAGKSALRDAGIGIDGSAPGLDKTRAGILMGSAMGGMTTFATAIETLHSQGYRRMNPFCIPFSILNMGGALMAMDTGFMGPNYAINTACATGNYTILNSYDHIVNGTADLMVAGAAEASIIPSGIGGFQACKALSKRNDDPAGASRPWDKTRDGFVMGEGAGVLILEELEHARARGARIYAEVAGGAYSCDAHHMTEPRPDGSGVRACLERAMEKAGVSADEVGYVNAHATSTPAGDLAEYRAITGAIPHESLRINATKSLVGHLLGAAAGVEAVVTVKALQRGVLHPNLNLNDPEEEVDTNILVGGEAVEHDTSVAISNSFGFGGHNSAVVFRKMHDSE